MKSAAYSSYKAAGAIPCEQDDDCRCTNADAQGCMDDVHERCFEGTIRADLPEKCTCICHQRYENAVKGYGLRAVSHVRKMLEDGANDETLLEVVRSTVESAVRCAATDRFLQ